MDLISIYIHFAKTCYISNKSEYLTLEIDNILMEILNTDFN